MKIEEYSWQFEFIAVVFEVDPVFQKINEFQVSLVFLFFVFCLIAYSHY